MKENSASETTVKSDIEIASSVELWPIDRVAQKMGLEKSDIESYGDHIAKIKLSARDKSTPRAKQVLVTAMTPTPAGEGKTTVSIGLHEALNIIGKKSIVTLREPSLGPVFGVKGGATGGGYSQVLPMADINLHFTGDMHAVSSAHNLLAAMLDNQYARFNTRNLRPREIIFSRVMDMNDRALRNIVIGLGKDAGEVRDTKFEITAASEVMAILGLSYDLEDLKQRLGNIIIAQDSQGRAVYAKDIDAHGAMAVLLKNAIKPNLVQTIRHNPAIIHTGPFANIAHGTNSLIANSIARSYADIVVTEAGFASDLGGEKFFNLVSRQRGAVPPDAVVIVATIRALKYHGGVARENLNQPDPDAVREGFENLAKHIENMQSFDRPVLVAVNLFSSDTAAEIDLVRKLVRESGAKAFPVAVWAQGGDGAVELAQAVWDSAHESHGPVTYTYDLHDSIADKIYKVATRIYGADDVQIPRAVTGKIANAEQLGYKDFPICIAKTQSSLSDNPKLKGRPTEFNVEIRDIKINAGAGFIVVYTSDIMTMPGLPEVPAAAKMTIDNQGNISGLF